MGSRQKARREKRDMRKQLADTLLKNGRFLTMEKRGEMAKAVAIAGGRILYVGTEEEAGKFVDEETEVIDLQGRVAAPGIIDCHTHPLASYAYRLAFLSLRGQNTRSLKRLLDCLREEAAHTPAGEWIVGSGYDESKFEEGATPLTAEILDTVSTVHPIYLTRTCGHIAALNTVAMERSGFLEDARDPEAGGHFFRDAEGRLTGMISGSVRNRVPVPTVSEEQRCESMIHKVQTEYFSKGITATGEMGASGLTSRLLQKMDKEGRLKLRVGYYYSNRRSPQGQSMSDQLLNLGNTTGFGTEHVRFMGIKLVTDGSTGGRTAAFSLPYADNPENYGELYYDQNVLNEAIYTSARAGIQVSIHAIGDRAIESALQGIEYANAKGVDTRTLRFRLEHLESPTPDQIRRIKELNLCVGLSSAFIYSLGDSHLSALGYDRLVDAFPAKTLLANGTVIGCNSDCPVCDVNPMYGIYSMVTRTTEAGKSFGGRKEAIDRWQALEAYTKNAAYLLCCEEVSGTLTAGKYADLVVFEQDYLNVPEEELKDIQVYMTVSGGEIVYRK